jgi:hypothetical protein
MAELVLLLLGVGLHSGQKHTRRSRAPIRGRVVAFHLEGRDDALHKRHDSAQHGYQQS